LKVFLQISHLCFKGCVEDGIAILTTVEMITRQDFETLSKEKSEVGQQDIFMGDISCMAAQEAVLHAAAWYAATCTTTNSKTHSVNYWLIRVLGG
jgi:hypothetical protein